jgi:hypothetical protein
LYELADKAGMSTRTARKYLKSGKLPSQSKIIHDWSTHPDAFAEDWPWIEEFLQGNPGLESKSLFETLHNHASLTMTPGKKTVASPRANEVDKLLTKTSEEASVIVVAQTVG